MSETVGDESTGAAAEKEAGIEEQLEQECVRACRPTPSFGGTGDPEAGENLLSALEKGANPFLSSAECPKTCRSLGRRHPTVNMEGALFEHVLRCAMLAAFGAKGAAKVPAEAAPPVAPCVAATPLNDLIVKRHARTRKASRRLGLPAELGGVESSQLSPVALEDAESLPESLSWNLAFWLLPLGPALCIGFGLAAARRLDRRRKLALSPSPGHRIVHGRICEDSDAGEPVIAVLFELEATTQRGQTSYKQKSHRLSARPFTIETEGGRLVDIQADPRHIELHAEVKGDDCHRSSSVVPGDKVWVYGREARQDRTLGVAALAARGHARPSQIRLFGSKSPILVSRLPIEQIFRRDRNRRLIWVASLLGLVAIVELSCFGKYIDLQRSGRPTTGYVTSKWSEWKTTTTRGGNKSSRQVYRVAVEAQGRTEEFEVSSEGWDDAREGSPVTVLVTQRNMALGSRPYATLKNSINAGFVLLLGLGLYLLLGRIDSAWYSTTRGWRSTDEWRIRAKKPG